MVIQILTAAIFAFSSSIFSSFDMYGSTLISTSTYIIMTMNPSRAYRVIR